MCIRDSVWIIFCSCSYNPCFQCLRKLSIAGFFPQRWHEGISVSGIKMLNENIQHIRTRMFLHYFLFAYMEKSIISLNAHKWWNVLVINFIDVYVIYLGHLFHKVLPNIRQMFCKLFLKLYLLSYINWQAGIRQTVLLWNAGQSFIRSPLCSSMVTAIL